MPSFVTLDSVSGSTPAGHILFSGLSLSFGGERTGLVGRNGAGKSTLLRLLAGDIPPAAGHITRSGSVGILRQALLAEDATVAEALGVAAALGRLERIEAGRGDETDFAEADWTLTTRITAALDRAGLEEVPLSRPLGSFSGGERTRIALAALLIDPPDLLLFDEPTNNLDAAGRAAIAELLATWQGGVVAASHDRVLLEDMDRIVALSPTGTAVHGGGWSSYVTVRDAARESASAALDRNERVFRNAEREAQAARERQARRDRAGRSYALSGSAPKILLGAQRERAENSAGRSETLAARRGIEVATALVEARQAIEVITPLTIHLPSTGLPANRTVLDFNDVSWSIGGRTVVHGLSFSIVGPERMAVTGPNGAGKTSVLRLATGEIAPSSGAIHRAIERVAILDQQARLLDRSTSILANMRRCNPALSDNAARAALARFAFRNIAAERLARDLSGGEALRAALACVLSAAPVPQLLLLDEPTNHLDIDSVEIIEAALQAYDGAILVVSHDSAFLEAIGVTRTIAPRPT